MRTLVGIDGQNIDSTADPARPAHTLLLAAGIPIVEHLTGLEQLPFDGFRFTAAPPRVKGMGNVASAGLRGDRIVRLGRIAIAWIVIVLAIVALNVLFPPRERLAELPRGDGAARLPDRAGRRPVRTARLARASAT